MPLVAAMALAGGASVAQDKLVFGYIPNNMAFPYNVALTDGFKEKAATKGVDVVILDSKMSLETQANQIDDLLQQGVAAIGFMPNDSVAVQALVDKVAAAGIPIAATAVPVGDPNVNPPDYVYPELTALATTDDVEGGRVAGRFAAEQLPKDRVVKIAVLEGAPGFAVVKQRQDGFEEALKAAGIQFEIVASQPTDWTPETGEALCQNILTANPDVDLIYSHADQMAIGCAHALSALGSNALLIDSAGGSTAGLAAVASGDLDGSVCNQPKLLGEMTFDVLYEAVTNKANAKKGQFLSYPNIAVSKDNIDECPPW
ncbi:sugar ABC transporter substrate-binding protein [Devosia sp. CN2-171]|uniref:sugar ABC transporter substrate-binding protein n=1 Tax=Devosia sp. CN2-171 TaxID=3400909 RepID=UPI003BF82744